MGLDALQDAVGGDVLDAWEFVACHRLLTDAASGKPCREFRQTALEVGLGDRRPKHVVADVVAEVSNLA